MSRLAMAAAACCVVVCLAVLAAAQTKDEGMRLYAEACKLHENAGSADDLQQVSSKYEQALRILE